MAEVEDVVQLLLILLVLCLNAPTMHHQKKIYVTFQWWLFMVDMTKVCNSEVGVCSPCDAAARPADYSTHSLSFS